MQEQNRVFLRPWQIIVAVVLFVMGTLALSALPYADKSAKMPSLMEAAYYTFGLFLGSGNPVGFPRVGPSWAVMIGRIVYFGAPIILAWTVVEALFRFTRSLTQSIFDQTERRARGMEGHTIICGLGKLGNMIVDWNIGPPARPALGVSFTQSEVIVLEKDPENPRIHELRERGVLVLTGDQTQPHILEKAGLHRAKKLIAVSGDDIANLDAAHIAAHMNSKLEVRCQVTNLQLQQLLQRASELNIHSFNSYDIAAQKLINQYLASSLEGQFAPLFVIAGIGRFGQMMIHHLLDRYKEREPSVVIVDRRGEHIARILRGTIPHAEDYIKPGHVYEGEIADPYVWRGIRDEHNLEHATVVLCTDDDVSNINTALMIEKQVGNDILVVSRMFREVSFMQRSQEHFRVAVLSQLIQQGLAESLAAPMETKPLETPSAKGA